MLKRKIDEATFNALPDVVKAEYTKNGNDYVLEVDDAKELINARDGEKRRADELKTENTALKAENATMKAANGDFTSLETSYKTQLAAKDKIIADTNTALTGERRDRHVGSAATEIANKHFIAPKLVSKEIAARLDLDPRDGKTVRVLDKDGKVSALTLDDLAKEFVDNADYKSIVKANQASGSAGNARGSASNGLNNPFTPPVKADGSPKNAAEMSVQELAAHSKATREAKAEGATTP